MLQATALRTVGDDFTAPILVTGEEHRFLVQEQLAVVGIAPETIILEPDRRNTAPAIAIAAVREARTNPDQLLLAMPSDHVIADPSSFIAAVRSGAPAAAAGSIVTFGISADAA